MTENRADIAAIEQLKYRYWRACDAKDAAGFRDCFVSQGGQVDFGPLGRKDPDEMVGIFTAITEASCPDGQPVVLDMHHGFHPSITITDTGEARGAWTLHFTQVNNLAGTIHRMTGEYDDTYRRENGEWKIATSFFTIAWSYTEKLDGITVTQGA